MQEVSMLPTASGACRPVAFVRAAPVALIVLTVSLAGSAGVGASPSPQVTPPIPITRPVLLTDPVPDPHRQPEVLWFAPTGHTLRGSFLDYWTHYGGLPQF